MSQGTPSWLRHSFFRLPSWRYARASWLHDRCRPISPDIDDEWVLRALRFLKSPNRSGSTRVHRDSRRRDAPIVLALNLAQDADAKRRWQIESLLLTTLPMVELASRFDLPVDVIEAYHQLFFEVRPHLAAGDWIMSQAIGTSYADGFAGLPLGSIWKFFGFAYGARAVEIIVAVTTNAPLPSWAREFFAGRPAYEEARFRFLGKLVVDALCAGSPQQLAAVIEARMRLRKLDRQVTDTPDEPPDLVSTIESA